MLSRFPGIVKENPYKHDKNENESNTPGKIKPVEEKRGLVSIILFGYKETKKSPLTPSVVPLPPSSTRKELS
jgi:hypothetical protein